MPELPSELLRNIALRSGRVALVLGAGCSFEPPTGLRLAKEYAVDAHRKLVQDGVIEDAACSDPEDLSVLASFVAEATGGQTELVRRLPAHEFRLARPNAGYLIAAALLREQAIDSVLTLNFDLALTNALTAVCATEVSVIPGPQASDLGGRTVVYLHRNVDEVDLEKWILTTEALDNDWREGWQEVVARRTMACRVVVFAGLGSPASVLTETVSRIRHGLRDGDHSVYVVDPAGTTLFEAALSLGPDAHVQLGWCDFMAHLADRVVSEMDAQLFETGREHCEAHGWSDEIEPLRDLSRRFHEVGLVELGQARAKWLLEEQDYSPDDARRDLIVDLLLGVALIERHSSLRARFLRNGVVELVDGESKTVATILLASGRGVLRWSALEPRVRSEISKLGSGTSRILVSGVVGARPVDNGPPLDVIASDDDSDIIAGADLVDFLTVDDLRSSPEVVGAWVA